MPVDFTQESERTPISTPESLRVRCPHCRKLYLVQYSDIQEAKPRFECVECRHRFWISLPDMDFSNEVDGLPIAAKEPAVSARTKAQEPCPKCFKLNPRGIVECAHCGVVISRIKAAPEIVESMPPHSPNLAALWQKVVAAFDENQRHEIFISAAYDEGSLAYAIAQYNRIKRLMPSDEITTARLAQIQALASTFAPIHEKREDRWAIHPWRHTRIWQIPLLIGAVLVMVGMSSPLFRNFAGLGAAFLFLAVALRPR